MSLEAFQQAFAHFAASPRRCIELRADETLADRFALEALEKRRLLEMVRHRGMSHHCTLYRANRLTAIARSLPRTCEQLGASLNAELEAFWDSSVEAELQFKREAERFARWLLRRIKQDGLDNGSLALTVDDELQALHAYFGTPVEAG